MAKKHFTLWLVALAALICSPAMAENKKPKQLYFPSQNATEPTHDTGGLPKEIVAERRRLRDVYNKLSEEEDQMMKECAAPQTQGAKNLCAQKQQSWDRRRALQRAETSALHLKISNWYRAQRGLPPELPPTPYVNSGSDKPATKPQAPAPTAPLLPSGDTALPAGTF